MTALEDRPLPSPGKVWTIGEMAAEFGVSFRTLRFYESRQLLRPRRQGSGRIYSEADRIRMQMIVKGKQLGFTLTEIQALLGNYDPTESMRVSDLSLPNLERQRRQIDDAIARLRTSHAQIASFSSPHRTEVEVASEEVAIPTSIWWPELRKLDDELRKLEDKGEANNIPGDASEVLARVLAWAGGEAEALFWYRSQPIAAFGDRTAESLVKSGQAAPLRDYLDSLALGGFA